MLSRVAKGGEAISFHERRGLLRRSMVFVLQWF